MKYIFLLFIFCLVVTPLSGLTAEVEFGLPDSMSQLNFWDDGGRFIGSLATSPPGPDLNITVVPSTAIAGRTDIYQVKIIVPHDGIPKVGGLSFNWPSEFGLNTITNIDYSDNYSGQDLEIRYAWVYGHTVTVMFKWGQSPPAGTQITLTVENIRNPQEAREYQVTGLVFNRWFMVTAGPTFSDRFDIIPDEPVALEVEPSDPLTLKAGEAQLFQAYGIDQFNNRTEPLEANWSLDGNIGTLEGGLFRATTTGQGRVMAEHDGLTGQSGMIRVIPGDLDKFVVSGTPEQVMAGEAFAGNVIVSAVDAFGNVKSDYDGIVYFESDDPSAVLPYTRENPYQFTESDAGVHEFSGDGFILHTAGQKVIIATNGEKSGQSNIIMVNGGPIVEFNLSGADSSVAGAAYVLSVENAVDQYGNPASGTIILELLAGNPSPNGDAPVLNAIEVSEGQGSAEQFFYAAERAIVRATSANDFSKDKSINVVPGEPGELALDIQPTQFVGYPLLGPSTLTVYDAYGNLKTNFDASTDPVELIVQGGSLTPSVLDGADDFVAGIADLEERGIVYNGDFGSNYLFTRTQALLSNAVSVVFNGLSFEVTKGLDDTIIAGVIQSLMYHYRNEGDVIPNSPIIVSVGFSSCGDGCQNDFVYPAPGPGADGIRTVQVPTDLLVPDTDDTLTVTLSYSYDFNGQELNFRKTISHALHVIQGLEVSYVENSLSLDSVIAPGVYDSLSLSLTFSGNMGLSVDYFYFYLNMEIGQDTINIASLSVNDSIMSQNPVKLKFENIVIPEINYSQESLPNTYHKLDIQSMYRGPFDLIRLNDLNHFDSMFVAKKATLSYMPNSLTPISINSGTETAFSFDISSDGIVPITIDLDNTSLVLNENSTSINIGLTGANFTIEPGNNHLTTESVTIPESLAGTRLSAYLDLAGTELYVQRRDSVFFSNDVEVTSGEKEMRIVTTYLDTTTAPNTPFLNTNQLFDLIVGAENLSPSDIDDATVYLLSESGRDTLASQSGISIPAESTAETRLNLIAPATTIPVWALKTSVSAPGATVLPAVDNIAVLVVQRPARIELDYSISGTYDNYVEIDKPFTISAFLKNLGESSVGRGEISLVTGTDAFGLPESTAVSLPLDSLVEFKLVAPLYETSAAFHLMITGIPVDKNTNDRADVENISSLIPIMVVLGEAELFVQGRVIPSPLIVEGETSDLFTLTLNNQTQSPLNVIGLNTIVAAFRNKDGHLISPDQIVITDETGFVENGELISESSIYGSRLNNDFTTLFLNPGESRTIDFRCRFADHISEQNFSVSIDSRDILARYISGPRAGQRVAVSGDFGESFELGSNFVVTPPSLEGSIIARKNPFNPDIEPAEVSYYLEDDAEINVIIFTLTGEKVIEMNFAAGTEGGRAGDNVIYWYGRNARNNVVLNGVYIMVLQNKLTGKSYRYKLAVLK